MTRLEKAKDMIMELAIKKACPRDFGAGLFIDSDSAQRDCSMVIGCRGVTCVECFGQEYKEDSE